MQQFYNTVDAWVVGRYAGEAEFAAIGISGAVMNLFLFVIVGACTGLSVIFAQLYGEGDLAAFRKEHFMMLLFGLLCTAAVSVLGMICAPWIMRLIRVPAELMKYVRAYLTVVLIGLPAAFLYNLYSALLRAVGRTYAVLLALTAAVCVNLGLDIYFVSGLGMGIRGAAWATVLAQSFSALLCMIYLRAAAPTLLFRAKDCALDRELLGKSARYSAVTGLHQAGLYIASCWFRAPLTLRERPLYPPLPLQRALKALPTLLGTAARLRRQSWWRKTWAPVRMSAPARASLQACFCFLCWGLPARRQCTLERGRLCA